MVNGTLIRQVRQGKHLTTSDIARAIGVSRAYVTQIELGKRHPNPEIQNKLSSILGVSIEEMQSQASEPLEVSNQTEEHVNNAGFSLNGVSAPVLFGAIQGTLLNIKSSISENCTLNLGNAMHGSVHAVTQQLDDVAEFSLFTSRESVILKLKALQSIENWLHELHMYTVDPDALVSMENSDKPQNWYVEFVWFTDYTSVYERTLQYRNWITEGKSVRALDIKLANYISD